MTSPADLAQIYLAQGQYADAVAAYEEAIATNPDHLLLHWNYSIALLLTKQEEEAQSVWMSILLEADSDAMQQELTHQLVAALRDVAQQCQDRDAYEDAWILQRYQCEFAPNNEYLVRDALLSGLLAEVLTLDDAMLEHFNTLVAESDQLFTETEIDKTGYLLRSLCNLDPLHPTVQTFATLCLKHVSNTSQADRVASLFLDIFFDFQKKSLFLPGAIRYAIQLAPDHPQILERSIHALASAQEERHFAIELAERLVSLAKTPVDRLCAIDTLLKLLIQRGGQFSAAQDTYAIYKSELITLSKAVAEISKTTIIDHPETIQSYVENLGDLYLLMAKGFLGFYFEDQLSEFRHIRNPLAAAAQAHMQVILNTSVQRYRSHHASHHQVTHRPLRVGYLASTFFQHSVGWLCRWLLTHHDRDRFDIHLYTSTAKTDDFVQDALVHDYGDRFHLIPDNIEAIANQIFDDEIDILVELDSMTGANTLSAVSLKPAPIQVSWLGLDASSLPAIDYFIADPYVLPDHAEQHYQEKIWRLPHTYIAVDGFEFHTPTLRRSDLDIPDDAIVYLNAQTGFKRNPHIIKLQLQIIKAVPNAYFLIKHSAAEPDVIQSFFRELAEAVGVSSDRLRFLSDFPHEFDYRATLKLAHVVLDTYPYNGATTTLEALWMGLPIVTRVGEQFAARNSYTMMINAGITEGIAWNDEEYVEWGIRLGQDEILRRNVVWKLRQSRHTAPLWNTKQFANEMENAYEQMWRTLR